MAAHPLRGSQGEDADPLEELARVCAGGVTAIAVAVFVGWIFDIAPLKSLSPAWASMKPNSAICFVLSGVSCWLCTRRASSTAYRDLALGRSFALAAGAIALATLTEYVFGVNLHIDELLFRDTTALIGTTSPGRMSPYTATSFVLVSTALLSSKRPSVTPRTDLAVILPVLAIALLSLASYVFGVPALRNFLGFTGLALLTATCFFTLSVGVLALRGNAGPLGIFNDPGIGGTLARRLLPWVVLVPIVLGWFRLEGQRVGLYGTEFGLALHTVANVTILALLVWFSARSLATADSARRDATGKMSATENRWRAIIVNGADGITLIARDGAIVYRSPSTNRVLGRMPENTTVSESYPVSVHPDDVETFSGTLAAVKREPGALARLEVRYKHGDGTWHWYEAALSNLLDDPDVSAIVVNYHDITTRKASEQALRESEERFREIAEHIQEVFFSVDLTTGQTLYISPTFAEIWGRPVADVYTNPMLWFECIHADDQAVVGASTAAIARGVPSDNVFRVIRPDKTIRWVRGRAFPVRNAAGQVHRMVGISQDVTELRRTEEQFMQAQKMEAVGRLAGGVAHDFNNLLTVIIAEADLARVELPPGSPLIEVLDDIRTSSERAAVLTRQLLAFSRKQLVEPVVFDVNDAVTDTAKLLRRLIGEDVRVELRLGRTAGSIRADRGQFEQVLTNLAVNARDAMPSGGMLGIETAVATLDEEYAQSRSEVRAGEYAVVIVSDTGTGMTPEVQARVFEPFFTTKDRGRGTGLGLATCYGIVKQAGGHIAIYSEAGVGTTFRVYFPLVDGGEVAANAAEQQEAPRGTEVVLMVEDEEAVRRVGARILRAQGYTVIEARDALEGLKLLTAHSEPIALLLTDVVLPGMGGRELAEHVRKQQPGVKVLFATGYTDDVILQHQLLSRDVVILQKPYTRVSLAQKVREVLDG